MSINPQYKYIRMVSALGDFQLALSAAIFLQEADENGLYDHIELRRFRCYEQTAIISYARPFSMSKGELPRLSLKQCGVRLSKKETKLHDWLLELRNQMVAHSDLRMMNFASKAYDAFESIGTPHHVLIARHDEGLQFSKWKDQDLLIALIRKVSFELYKTLHELAQSDPSAFELKLHFPGS